jgi:hypothetical protein
MPDAWKVPGVSFRSTAAERHNRHLIVQFIELIEERLGTVHADAGNGDDRELLRRCQV